MVKAILYSSSAHVCLAWSLKGDCAIGDFVDEVGQDA